MKTHKDPRHIKRIRLMQALFANNFSTQTLDDQEIQKTVSEIDEKKGDIDKLIVQATPSWPIERINKIDLAILRLAIFELIFVKTTPVKVVIDEAVEIAKEYGSESSPSFVNGVLGHIAENP